MGGSIRTIMTDLNHLKPWHLTDSDLSPGSMFMKGESDYEEAARTTIELLKRINVECDKSAVSQINTECHNLAKLGFAGRIFPKLVSIAESADPTSLITIINEGSCSHNDPPRVISANEVPQMRIAIYRAQESSVADPVLHYLNMSYSSHA